MFLKTRDELLLWLKICCRPEIPADWWQNMKCFSLRLYLFNSRSFSRSRRQIVNPHCRAASGRASGHISEHKIHHVWCGWCSHNSGLTGVMFAGIIQPSINTRAWKKYGAFIKTVNRNREGEKCAGFPWPEVCVIILLIIAKRNSKRKHIYGKRLKSQGEEKCLFARFCLVFYRLWWLKYKTLI